MFRLSHVDNNSMNIILAFCVFFFKKIAEFVIFVFLIACECKTNASLMLSQAEKIIYIFRVSLFSENINFSSLIL